MRRVLVYTHNSIGLGHAVRTLSVITGMRKWRPDLDFLVLSGGSAPQLFLDEGIDIVKLPGIKQEVDKPGAPYIPRYLNSFSVFDLFDYRTRVILDTLDFFKPDVVMIEHTLTGLKGEAIPLVLRKNARRGRTDEFALLHLSRGIYRSAPMLYVSPDGYDDSGDRINVAALYDFIYVLEDRSVCDLNAEYLGDSAELTSKIRYLGRIAPKTREELPPRQVIINRWGLSEKSLVVMSLGRHGQVAELAGAFFEAFERLGFFSQRQVVIFFDPYLPAETRDVITAHPLAHKVRFLPFAHSIVELLSAADLAVCRAGYNIVNEVLLTQTKAVVIPEQHPNREQERRAATMPAEMVTVCNEKDVLNNKPDATILDLLARDPSLFAPDYDKYTIGRRILEDLGNWNKGK
jgi:predicted glycosyltransferase